MRKVIYITSRPLTDGMGGREQLSAMNSSLLSDLYGAGFERIELNGRCGFIRLFGYVDGVTPSMVEYVCERIAASGARQVFLDGSNLGRLAEGIKRAWPDIEILTFFHNCEARFFLGALRRAPSVKSAAVLWANFLAERCAVRFSDKRICLSERDSAFLNKLYGRGATHLSAMALKDKLSTHQGMGGELSAGYVLFVGGAFYANQAGIEWFCKHISPRITLRTCVVGRGLEANRVALEQHCNVEVIGEVSDLGPWYRNAHVVVAPIFDGSGMKTKVAEALMFGKRVIGTPEAFSGYEPIAAITGEVCRNVEEFVTALDEEARRPLITLDPQLRAIYEAEYSYEAAKLRLGDCLDAFDSNNPA